MIVSSSLSAQVIFDFNEGCDLQQWRVVDDGVMGGRSKGNIIVTDEGHGKYYGKISLDNNGGFSSIRYRFAPLAVKHYKNVVIRLKGDGRKYQFRVKANSQEYYSYIAPFHTSGEWEEITISLEDMYPMFRGRAVDLPNFSNDYLQEITFLIGNKKVDEFVLLIDKIELK